MANWRADKRNEIEERFLASAPGESSADASPSGRYELTATQWSRDGGWTYCEAVIGRRGEEPIAVVRRNYSIFPFTFAEDHPNGHDYLICGEDYQGQTIVELDTGTRIDHLPDEAEKGHGFCWAAHYVSPDQGYLIIDGCYWACPYEIVVYDFTDPLEAPLRELHRFEMSVVDTQGFDGDVFVWTAEEDVRASDGKSFEDLSEDEIQALLDEEGRFEPGSLTTRIYRNEWRVGTPFESATRNEVIGD